MQALNLLVVDDGEGDAKILKRAFEQNPNPTRLTVLPSGTELLAYLRRQPPYADAASHPWPDMILMDIRMPGMDGFETLKAIRGEPEWRDTPVVVMSTSSGDADVYESYKLGAVSFIQKPFDYDKLCEFVNGFNTYWRVINKLPSRKETPARTA